MNLEERIRTAIENLDAEPRSLAHVVADGRRRRTRTRALVSGAGAVVIVVVLAGLAAVGGATTGPDRGVSPAPGPVGRPPEPAGGGDATVGVIARDRRRPAIEVAGLSATGMPLDVSDFRGEIVLVRFWGSFCAPCLEDAAILADLVDRPEVVALGVAVREPSGAGVRATEQEAGFPFESIWDRDLAVTTSLGEYEPRGLPLTLVLDREGRVAATQLGELSSAAALGDAIDLVAAEPAG